MRNILFLKMGTSLSRILKWYATVTRTQFSHRVVIDRIVSL